MLWTSIHLLNKQKVSVSLHAEKFPQHSYLFLKESIFGRSNKCRVWQSTLMRHSTSVSTAINFPSCREPWSLSICVRRNRKQLKARDLSGCFQLQIVAVLASIMPRRTAVYQSKNTDLQWGWLIARLGKRETKWECLHAIVEPVSLIPFDAGRGCGTRYSVRTTLQRCTKTLLF
jgi:hypothetical protein